MIDGSTVVLLLRMTVSLAVVLSLIVWAARALARRQAGLLGRTQRHVPVAVLARQSLSRHAGLSVVQVGAEILVLGVTDAEVSLLTRMDPAALTQPEPQDTDPAREAAGSSTGVEGHGVPTFAQALRQATALAIRRDVKHQAQGARLIADRVSEGPDRGGGRHRA